MILFSIYYDIQDEFNLYCLFRYSLMHRMEVDNRAKQLSLVPGLSFIVLRIIYLIRFGKQFDPCSKLKS